MCLIYTMVEEDINPNELIIVSYKAFKRKGTLPLLQHEWAHAYGALRSDHSNLKSVKHCINY